MNENYCIVCENKETQQHCSDCLPTNFKFNEKRILELSEQIFAFMEVEGDGVSEALIIERFRNFAPPSIIRKILSTLIEDIKIFISSKEIHYAVY